MATENLEAGEELDWLVLHHVFDWKRGVRAFGEAPFRRGSEPFDALWPVSSDLANAWKVIDHAVAVGLAVTVQSASDASPGWRVTFRSSSGVEAEGYGETVPLAICMAALRAVEAALLVKSSRLLPAAGGVTLN
ncbi:hypothetical protein D3C72_1872220 [compost metagenome]